MRVLHINAGNMYGGVETLLAALARLRGLCPGMEPLFGLCYEGRLSQELKATGASVFSLGETRVSRFWTIARARRRLKSVLGQEKVDVVIAHMPWNHALAAPVAKEAGIPLITWVHGISEPLSWVDRWARLTPPKLAICNSRFTESAVEQLFPHVPHQVVYLPVESPEAKPGLRDLVRQEMRVDSSTTVVLQVSRMERWKGHELHLRALAEARPSGAWECWIAGGPQRTEEQKYLDELKVLAHALGIGDRVRFLGQRSDVPSLMAAADLFCQPNLAPEPFGLVFVEALRAGLPVISTRMGGVPEIVDESCATLAEPKDVAGLARNLKRLMESPELRAAYSHAARQRGQAICQPEAQLRALQEVLITACNREVQGCTLRPSEH